MSLWPSRGVAVLALRVAYSCLLPRCRLRGAPSGPSPRSLEAWTEAWESPGPEPLPRCRGSLRHSGKAPQSQKYVGGAVSSVLAVCVLIVNQVGAGRQPYLPLGVDTQVASLSPQRQGQLPSLVDTLPFTGVRGMPECWWH